jgi:hypothetical protein
MSVFLSHMYLSIIPSLDTRWPAALASVLGDADVYEAPLTLRLSPPPVFLFLTQPALLSGWEGWFQTSCLVACHDGRLQVSPSWRNFQQCVSAGLGQ